MWSTLLPLTLVSSTNYRTASYAQVWDAQRLSLSLRLRLTTLVANTTATSMGDRCAQTCGKRHSARLLVLSRSCDEFFLLNMRRWAKMRVTTIKEGIREHTGGLGPKIVLVGDREFIPREDETMTADLYMSGLYVEGQ